ncbi:MAG: XdhC family protein [Patulibacter minatonensis]
MRELISTLDRWQAARPDARAALCTVVAIHGRAPLPLGASMLVSDDGATAGAVSGGCVERDVREAAMDLLRAGTRGASRRLRFAPGGDGLTGAALPCGGGIDVWVQPWGWGDHAEAHAAFGAASRAGSPATWRFEVGEFAIPGVALRVALEPTAGVANAGGAHTLSSDPLGRLVLVGAGPLAGALCELAPTIGMRPIVVEPRDAVAAHAPTEAADELLLLWPEQALAQLGPMGERDAVLALSHHPAIDDVALRAAVVSGAGFVGALGSRTSHAERLERLRARGLGGQALARIVGPVGLDLGGWAPGEVALSIAAELVAARHGRTGGRLRDAEGSIHGAAAARPPIDTDPGIGPELARPAMPRPEGPPLTAIVLAAGAGRRFGGAKQAAEWEGVPLVARAVRAASDGLPEGSEVLVVVGAHEAAVRAALPADVPHRVVVATDWADGIGASLRAGLAAARTSAPFAAAGPLGGPALVLLADQPLVDAALVARVVADGLPALASGAAAARPIVGTTPGHPVLLGPIALTRAADLAGDRGLGPLLDELHVHEVDPAAAGPAAVLDVDHPSDLLASPAAPLWPAIGVHASGAGAAPGAAAAAARRVRPRPAPGAPASADAPARSTRRRRWT